MLNRLTLPFLLIHLLAATAIGCSCGRESNNNHSASPSPDTVYYVSKQQPESTIAPVIDDTTKGIELPKVLPGQKLIHKSGYSLVYSEPHEQALWVAYELTASETNSSYARTDKFMSDPEINTGSAKPTDYKGTGLDRGHLAPAGDMGWSAKSMAESFYMSNMSPQAQGFNRGIWKKLEELVRTWAVEYGAVCVVTAGILSNDLPAIGSTAVSVPAYYYKVVLDHTGPEYKAIGFIMPNASSKASLQSYAVPIDEVERVTGIDFFPLLDNQLEEQLENRISIGEWTWRSNSTSRESGSSSSGLEAVQCSGTTQKGLPCRNRTKDPSGRCHHHR
ncbi:MAG: DNA/RNA non-specific endonuclease [Bacteroidota bacterium]